MQDNKATILIVDDTIENIDLLKNILEEDYNIKAAVNGEQALKIIEKNNKIDMILLDIMMPGIDGYEVCERIKKNPATEHIPIIFITAMSDYVDEKKGLAIGAVDYIIKPINPSITLARIQTHLKNYELNRLLDTKVKQRTQELEATQIALIRQLGRAAEYKDNETGMHVIRVGHYTKLIAESMVGKDTPWTDLMFQAAPLHDIGKIGIPDNILTKPGKLDSEEYKIMQTHCEIGANIIGDVDSPLLQLTKEIALNHHEKFDGTGYPRGLKGEEIAISGRIVSVADVFDALTSERPYKKAWSVEDSVAYIEGKSGKDFDPNVVEHFIKVLNKICIVKEKFPDHLSFSEYEEIK